ncbi:MAG TPA: SPOR domain-containing protein [Runella sp.]|nr:SPOR domain-containing protein [Runella sp.]HAO48573.1 SPOR domain-containing protein [Runella sp.]
MIFKYLALGMASALLLIGCVTSKPVGTKSTTTVDPYSTYDEDFTAIRPRYKETVTSESATAKKPEVKRVLSDQPLHINRQLDAVVDTIALRNKSIRFAGGFRIQIYVGNTRKEADDARLYSYQSFPELNPYMVYNQPTYRIRIGDFMTRLDAERYLQQVRQRYESAVVVPEKIDLKKSLLVK